MVSVMMDSPFQAMLNYQADYYVATSTTVKSKLLRCFAVLGDTRQLHLNPPKHLFFEAPCL